MNSTILLDEICTSTLNNTSSDNLNFQDIITNPLFYGGILLFIVLLSCVITFIFILKSKKKRLFPK